MDVEVLHLTVIPMFEEILEEPKKAPKKEFKGQRKWFEFQSAVSP